MKLGIFSAMAAGLLALAAAPAWAHHSFAASYDMNQSITVHGTIKEVLLRNPHSWFRIDVKDQNGKIEEWSFEAGTPSGMIRNGFKSSELKPGTEVTIKGFRGRDLTQYRGMLNELTTADGKVYKMFGPQQGPEAK